MLEKSPNSLFIALSEQVEFGQKRLNGNATKSGKLNLLGKNAKESQEESCERWAMRCALEELSAQNRGGCDRRTPRSTGRCIASKKSLSHHQRQPDDSDQHKAECTGFGCRGDGSNHHVAG